MADNPQMVKLVDILAASNDDSGHIVEKLSEIVHRDDDPMTRALRDELAKADLVKRGVKIGLISGTEQKHDRSEQNEIDALPEGFKERMATMGLAGYRFHRGMFYWRVISSDNLTVDSLQTSLQICIAKAEEHHEQHSRK